MRCEHSLARPRGTRRPGSRRGLLFGEITSWLVDYSLVMHKTFDPDAPWGEVDQP